MINAFQEIPKQTFYGRILAPCLTLAIILFGVCSEIARNQQLSWIETVLHIPTVCFSEPAEDFQRAQCQEFWSRFQKSWMLLSIPIGIPGLLLFFGHQSITQVYSRANRKIAKREFKEKGIVTDPPAAGEDLFSWIFCLKPIVVQLPNKTQIKIYTSLNAAQPRPGETFAIIDFGPNRKFGFLYAPHVAVVRGSR